MYKLNKFDKLSFLITIIGSICLGIKGIANEDLIFILLSNISSILMRIIYLFIAVSALNVLIFIIKNNNNQSSRS